VDDTLFGRDNIHELREVRDQLNQNGTCIMLLTELLTEVQTSSLNVMWHHVSSKENPSDCLSCLSWVIDIDAIILRLMEWLSLIEELPLLGRNVILPCQMTRRLRRKFLLKPERLHPVQYIMLIV
jgi:hypothetical protein